MTATVAPPVVCPICGREVEELVVDPFDGIDWHVCRDCKRVGDAMADDPDFVTDPRYALEPYESLAHWIRRLHALV